MRVSGTSTTFPKSNGIVDVVLGIVPDGLKGGDARLGPLRRQRAFALAGRDKVDEVFDFLDP